MSRIGRSGGSTPASSAPPPGAPGRVFSLVIPPPNVTGSLHIGHMLEHTEIDVTVRWHRMLGDNTLWLPGTDHAGIATQMVVERKLAEEGINRRDLGREEFEKRVWEWKAQYGDTIKNQMVRLGASCDWTRERFTLDAGLSRAVREVFVRLYEKGLIYRGEYMVNWCPRCHTAISDLEVAHDRRPGPPLAHPLPGERHARPLRDRGHHAARDHARRYRRRHQPEGRALPRPARQDRPAAADGSRDPHHPRRAGRSRIRHRRGQSHARARSERFRSRTPPQPAEDPGDRRDTAT